jgi:DNA-binding SARP family transcriptional activator
MTLLDRRRVRLLGPASVDLITIQDQLPDGVGGFVPRFRSWRTIGLLGYLTAERRPVARDLLAGLFWPDEEISRGRANLSRELHNLTRILPSS